MKVDLIKHGSNFRAMKGALVMLSLSKHYNAVILRQAQNDNRRAQGDNKNLILKREKSNVMLAPITIGIEA